MQKPNVVIVGAGVAGLISALVASRLGYRTIVIEAGTEVGGLWSTSTVELAGHRFDLDSGLRLPTKSGVGEWDAEIFHNPHIDFDWIAFDGWPVESSLFAGTFTPESSCVNAMSLASDVLREGIADFARAQALDPSTDPNAYGNDAAYVGALYGTVFRDQLFRPVIKGLTGLSLEDSAPGSARAFVPKRLILCEASEIPSLLAEYPSLHGYLGHSRHDALPKGAAKQFIYPASGGIGRWIRSLSSYLQQLGVEFMMSSRVVEIKRDGAAAAALTLNTGAQITSDKIIWTVPPVMLTSCFKEIDVAPIRPDLMSLSVQHIRLDRLPADLRAQYILNFESEPRFFRSIFWQNIVAGMQDVITMEILLNSGVDAEITAGMEKNWCMLGLKQLEDGGVLSRDVRMLDRSGRTFRNVLPKITPAYKAMNDKIIRNVGESSLDISCVGRAAGDSLFLDDIVRNVLARFS